VENIWVDTEVFAWCGCMQLGLELHADVPMVACKHRHATYT